MHINSYMYLYVCVLVAQSCPTLCNPMTVTYQAPLSMEFSRQEYWSGLPFLSPGDLPDMGRLKPGLLHCGQILHPLSHQQNKVYIQIYKHTHTHTHTHTYIHCLRSLQMECALIICYCRKARVVSNNKSFICKYMLLFSVSVV